MSLVGEIHDAWVEFRDKPGQGKDRPCIIVREEKDLETGEHLLMLMPITSQQPKYYKLRTRNAVYSFCPPHESVKIPLTEWSISGLREISWAQPNIVFTIEISLLGERRGTCTEFRKIRIEYVRYLKSLNSES